MSIRCWHIEYLRGMRIKNKIIFPVKYYFYGIQYCSIEIVMQENNVMDFRAKNVIGEMNKIIIYSTGDVVRRLAIQIPRK